MSTSPIEPVHEPKFEAQAKWCKLFLGAEPSFYSPKKSRFDPTRAEPSRLGSFFFFLFLITTAFFKAALGCL